MLKDYESQNSLIGSGSLRNRSASSDCENWLCLGECSHYRGSKKKAERIGKVGGLLGGLERVPATTCLCGVRVIDHESFAHNRFYVVDFGAINVLGALIVY